MAAASRHQLDLDELRDEFKRLRLQLGFSQQHVASEFLGITQARLSAWETSKNRSMRTETLNKIFQLVGTWRALEARENREPERRDGNIVRLQPANFQDDSTEDTSETRQGTRDEHVVKLVRSYVTREVLAELGESRMSPWLLDEMDYEQLCSVFRRTRQTQVRRELRDASTETATPVKFARARALMADRICEFVGRDRFHPIHVETITWAELIPLYERVERSCIELDILLEDLTPQDPGEAVSSQNRLDTVRAIMEYIGSDGLHPGILDYIAWDALVGLSERIETIRFDMETVADTR